MAAVFPLAYTRLPHKCVFPRIRQQLSARPDKLTHLTTSAVLCTKCHASPANNAKSRMFGSGADRRRSENHVVGEIESRKESRRTAGCFGSTLRSKPHDYITVFFGRASSGVAWCCLTSHEKPDGKKASFGKEVGGKLPLRMIGAHTGNWNWSPTWGSR